MTEEPLNFYIEDMRKDGEFPPAPSLFEEIMEDPTNHGVTFFEMDVQEDEPPMKMDIALPSSVYKLTKSEKSPPAFLATAVREKLHMTAMLEPYNA